MGLAWRSGLLAVITKSAPAAGLRTPLAAKMAGFWGYITQHTRFEIQISLLFSSGLGILY